MLFKLETGWGRLLYPVLLCSCFPKSFCFQLSEDEFKSLRSQIATYAMLSAVLKSDTAIKISINIMNTFVVMCRFIANNALLFEHISNVELKQLEYQKQTDAKLEQIFEYISEHEESSQKGFFDSQIYDAFSLLSV